MNPRTAAEGRGRARKERYPFGSVVYPTRSASCSIFTPHLRRVDRLITRQAHCVVSRFTFVGEPADLFLTNRNGLEMKKLLFSQRSFRNSGIRSQEAGGRRQAS